LCYKNVQAAAARSPEEIQKRRAMTAYAMKKAVTTRKDCKSLFSWHAIFRYGISVPLIHVKNPKIKNKAPMMNIGRTYDFCWALMDGIGGWG